MTVLAGRLARGERLPGFGQPLYPDGDPRAVAILAALARSAPPPSWAGAPLPAGRRSWQRSGPSSPCRPCASRTRGKPAARASAAHRRRRKKTMFTSLQPISSPCAFPRTLSNHKNSTGSNQRTQPHWLALRAGAQALKFRRFSFFLLFFLIFCLTRVLARLSSYLSERPLLCSGPAVRPACRKFSGVFYACSQESKKCMQ